MNIKSFTDLEQSKKLSGILPLDSADHCFLNDGTAIKAEINSYNVALQLWKDHYVEIIPAWSLAALLNVLPESYQLTSNKEGKVQLMLIHQLEMDYYDNPVDAVVDMIFKLKEEGKL